ncbi:TetR/AcrR family transcriptional regulator [Cytobacillus sp. Hm23]
MKDKKIFILETAMKLFAQNGYHNTSMQEIAHESGVAKGSLYNYFSSKEELFLSIFKHFYEHFTKQMSEQINDEIISERDRFIIQIHRQLKEFTKYRDFLQMHMREKAFPERGKIKTYLFQMRIEMYRWYKSRILAIYGDDIRPFAFDLTAMFSGMLVEYLSFLIFDYQKLDLEKLAGYLVDRLDDLVKSVANKQEVIINEDSIRQYFSHLTNDKYQEIVHMILQMKEIIIEANLSNDDEKHSLETLEVLLTQFQNNDESPRVGVVQGLLLFLEKLQIDDLMKYITSIRSMI